jgi:hypothetical protein
MLKSWLWRCRQHDPTETSSPLKGRKLVKWKNSLRDLGTSTNGLVMCNTVCPKHRFPYIPLHHDQSAFLTLSKHFADYHSHL